MSKVSLQLTLTRERDSEIFNRFLKQARNIYNYPGNKPKWLPTTTPGRQAQINVTCNVQSTICKSRNIDRQLQCIIRDFDAAPRLLLAIPLAEDRKFMRSIETILCQKIVARVNLNLTNRVTQAT